MDPCFWILAGLGVAATVLKGQSIYHVAKGFPMGPFFVGPSDSGGVCSIGPLFCRWYIISMYWGLD